MEEGARCLGSRTCWVARTIQPGYCDSHWDVHGDDANGGGGGDYVDRWYYDGYYSDQPNDIMKWYWW